jgi:hypothetical protein
VIDDGLTNAVRVGDLRLLAHPDSVVHDRAEVLDEVAVQIRRDRRDDLVDEDIDACIRGARRPRREREAGPCRGSPQEMSSVHSVLRARATVVHEGARVQGRQSARAPAW